jgi:heptosyltransferase II
LVSIVFNTAFIGDLLLSIPLLRQIRRLEPQRHLILVCRPGLAQFFLDLRLVDEVIELNKSDKNSKKSFYSKIGSREIESIFCTHQSFHSALILKKLKAKNKISFTSWWGRYFFTHLVPRPMMLPEPLRQLAILSPIYPLVHEHIEKFKIDTSMHNAKARNDINDWGHHIPHDLALYVQPPLEKPQEVLHKFNLKRPYVVIAPSSQWATKRWVDSGFVSLIHKLSERGLNFYLIGSPTEKEHCANLAKLAAITATRVEVRSLAGLTNLTELHALMSLGEVIVANDSGPMHMAAVAGRPVVAIFGPTTLDLGYRPWADLSYIVQKDLPCRPCGKHGHNKCPINTHDCMKKISADDIIRGFDALSAKSRPAVATSPSEIY